MIFCLFVHLIKANKNGCLTTVNSEILARILFSQKAVKFIFAMFKICD